MANKVIQYTTLAFCFLWAFLIFVDYWFYHPSYLLSIQRFQYTELTSVLMALGGGLGYWRLRNGQGSKRLSFFENGLGILLLFTVITAIIIPMHYRELGLPTSLSFSEVLVYIGKILFVLLSTYFIYLVSYVLGKVLLDKWFTFEVKPFTNILLSIATGITVLSIILFILAFLNLLSTPLLWGLFLLIAGLFWKKSWSFVKVTLLQQIPKSKELNWLGFISLFLLLVFISLLYLQNIRPVPFGFDALALYLNLPKMIYEKGGLVAGSSPYYWSLFISLGYFLFQQIEVVISLAVSGGILSAFALYDISRKWMDKNFSLLTGLLFYSLPLVNYQSYRDIKIDLGLLFMLLIVILLLLNFQKYISPTLKPAMTPSKRKASKQKTFRESPLSLEMQYLLLMGLFSGIALGIKLTSLILIFSVVASFFFINTGIIGLMTSTLLMLFVILIAGLDVDSGLRGYHFGVNWFRWVLLGGGLIGLFLMLFKDPQKSMQLIKWCAIYGGFVLLTYLPWPLKNYSETKTISFQTFIRGKGEAPASIR